MSMLDELKELDVNVDEALQRFLNKAELYEKMLKKLPPVLDGKRVLTAIDAGDIDGAIETAHTMKGVLGNLSITPLYKSYTDIVALLRSNEVDEARKILEESFSTEEKIIACIEKY